MAERGGFEPPVPFWSTHDFQSCTIGQLCHLSVGPCGKVWDLAVAGSEFKHNPSIIGNLPKNHSRDSPKGQHQALILRKTEGRESEASGESW